MIGALKQLEAGRKTGDVAREVNFRAFGSLQIRTAQPPENIKAAFYLPDRTEHRMLAVTQNIRLQELYSGGRTK
jgi:hypothetical protein